MSDRMSDEQLDARLRAFLVRRAGEIAAEAPPSDVVAVKLADRVRTARGRLAWWWNLPSGVRVAIALGLSLAALAALAVAAARLTTLPPTNGPITFLDGSDIVVVGADGTGQRTLTTVQPTGTGAYCCWLSYSPDGSRLLVGTDSSVDIMNADGTDRRELLHGTALGHPTWASDGNRVALPMLVQGFEQIFVVDSAGGAPRQVTTGLAYAFEPTWSHDGRWIALTGERMNGVPQSQLNLAGRLALFVVAPDGTNLHQVGPDMTPGLEFARSGPKWSPDDRSIVFDVDDGRLLRSSVIGMVAADGTGFHWLLPDGLEGSAPNWSPDGSWIDFAGWQTGAQKADLYVIRPDGSGVRRLATDVSWFEHPWSPDGTLIAFGHMADTNGTQGAEYAELREIRVDGSGEQVVAAHHVSGTIAWSPLQP